MSELCIEAKTEKLQDVLDFVEQYLKDCSREVRSDVCIAVDEIFSNIVNHSEADDVTVRVSSDERILLEFEDDGEEYNPLLCDDPDVELPLDERNLGGLGIFLVKNLMDSLEYRYEQGRNILTISKQLNQQ